jgi:hypothetical protein
LSRNFDAAARIVQLVRGLRRHLSYANVMATIAVFLALGGTSYALATLPRNSVGSKQIRPKAVGSSEVRDRSLRVRDISRPARRSLRGQQGPLGVPGPPGAAAASFTASVDATGAVTASKGGAVGSLAQIDSGNYDVVFNRNLTACWAVATLSRVQGGRTVHPENGEITTATTERGVNVRTRNSSGAPADLPFHLIVVC